MLTNRPPGRRTRKVSLRHRATSCGFMCVKTDAARVTSKELSAYGERNVHPPRSPFCVLRIANLDESGSEVGKARRDVALAPVDRRWSNIEALVGPPR